MNVLQDHDHDICPECGAELCGGLIRETIAGGPYSEEEIRDMYGDKLCYSQTIGVEMQGVYDGVLFWHYPCCGAWQGRFTGLVYYSQPAAGPELRAMGR